MIAVDFGGIFQGIQSARSMTVNEVDYWGLILLGGKWEVRERRVYEDRLGSDHFPVMATLGF